MQYSGGKIPPGKTLTPRNLQRKRFAPFLGAPDITWTYAYFSMLDMHTMHSPHEDSNGLLPGALLPVGTDIRVLGGNHQHYPRNTPPPVETAYNPKTTPAAAATKDATAVPATEARAPRTLTPAPVSCAEPSSSDDGAGVGLGVYSTGGGVADGAGVAAGDSVIPAKPMVATSVVHET